MKRAKLVMKRNKRNAFWWDIVAANGEILCNSEIYSSKHECQRGMEAVTSAMFQIVAEIINREQARTSKIGETK